MIDIDIFITSRNGNKTIEQPIRIAHGLTTRKGCVTNILCVWLHFVQLRKDFSKEKIKHIFVFFLFNHQI